MSILWKTLYTYCFQKKKPNLPIVIQVVRAAPGIVLNPSSYLLPLHHPLQTHSPSPFSQVYSCISHSAQSIFEARANPEIVSLCLFFKSLVCLSFPTCHISFRFSMSSSSLEAWPHQGWMELRSLVCVLTASLRGGALHGALDRELEEKDLGIFCGATLFSNSLALSV